MKFVHIADTHLDSAFEFLSNKADLGYIRRMDQRNAFRKMIDYIKENSIEYLFISGDLYEHSTIRESTIEYINSLFKQIPETRIIITPGNHDPLIKNSYYNIFDWSENVHIFGRKVSKLEFDDINIYGCGFDDFTLEENELNNITISEKSKINILVTHASLDGSKEQNIYNPISTSELQGLGFDYIALGHIHKRNLEKSNQLIVYPGSTCSMGFDELGEHGMVVGEILKENGKTKRNIQFIPLDSKEFIKKRCSVDDMNSLEELAESINLQKYDSDKIYEIVFAGNRKFEINKYKLEKLIEPENVIKLKDETKIGYDIDEISKENSLKGIFIRKMQEKYKNKEIDRETMENAIEYGLESLGN